MAVLQRAYFNGYNGSHFYIELNYDENVDIDHNRSIVTYTLVFGSQDGYSGGGSGSVGYINGVAVGSVGSIGVNTAVVVGVKQETIYHNQDGSGSTNYSASYTSANWGIGNASLSGGITLTKINRYAVTNNVTGDDIEGSFSVDYSKYINEYKYKLRISVPNVVELDKFDYNTPKESFELSQETIEELYRRFTNTNRFSLGFAVETWNSDETSMLYGGNEKVVTVSITNANPTFTYTCEETNANVISVLGGDDTDYLIQNASVPSVTVTPTTLKGATVSRVELTNGTYKTSKTIAPYRFNFTAVDGKIDINVVDSRSNTASGTIQKTLIEYQPVAINSFNFERQNPTSSNIILNADMKYYQRTFNQTANQPTLEWMVISNHSGLFPSDNLFPGNDVYIGATWNEISSSDYTIDTQNNRITISNLILSNVIDYREKAELYIRIKDLLTEANNHMTIIKGIPTIDMGEHDLQVNGDLYVADENRENKVNILETLQSLIPVTIYENSSGNIGNIILDDSIENYKKIKIYGISSADGTLYVSQEFLTDNQNSVILQIDWNTNGNGIVYPSGTHYTINGTVMTMDYHYRIGLYSSNQGYDSSTNNFAIVKIEGYK